jgi:hypothetical protein
VQKLNFPSYKFRLKNSENKTQIFDEVRKKFVVLQPEEWVRQHCLQYLINEKKYPISLINVEKELFVHHQKKRYDIVVYNKDGSVHCIIECKAPSIKIDQEVFDQIAQYNLTLDTTYMMITNGLNHYYCTMNTSLKSYQFLESLPDYISQNSSK